MKTSTIILIAVGGVAGVYILTRVFSSSSPTALAAAARAKQQQQSTAATSIGQALGGLIGGIFSSHGAGTANSSSAVTGFSGNAGAYSDAASQAALSGLQGSSTITTTDNFIYTDPSGDFLVG